jgi:glutamine cyclotransferase
METKSYSRLLDVMVSLLLIGLLSSCAEKKGDGHVGEIEARQPAIIDFELVRTHKHDNTAFTEGLLMHRGKLLESTGSPEDMPETRSVIGEVDLSMGKLTVKAELDRSKYFGEGISILGGKLYQLTYQNKVGFVYDAETYSQTGMFTFPGKEGWGMTTDGASLIMSDGTNSLYYLDPKTMATAKTLHVNDASGPVYMLNELELINGALYANVYGTSQIVKIDTATGDVTGRIDLTSLANEAHVKYAGAMEMNGIAYNPANGTVYITGKMWPSVYEIRFKY